MAASSVPLQLPEKISCVHSPPPYSSGQHLHPGCAHSLLLCPAPASLVTKKCPCFALYAVQCLPGKLLASKVRGVGIVSPSFLVMRWLPIAVILQCLSLQLVLPGVKGLSNLGLLAPHLFIHAPSSNTQPEHVTPLLQLAVLSPFYFPKGFQLSQALGTRCLAIALPLPTFVAHPPEHCRKALPCFC